MALEDIQEQIINTYHNLEDKWYSLIDRIDEKVPIGNAIERIDSVAPSFAIFIALLAILSVAAIISLSMGQSPYISFQVVDQDGAAVENASVQIFVDGEEAFFDSTDAEGETETASFEPGTTITVFVEKNGFGDFTDVFELNAPIPLYKISLEALEERTYTISLKDNLGQPVLGEATLSFACRNPSISAPEDMVVTGGTATIVEPAGCNGLIVSARREGFEFKDSVELVQSRQTIYLQETQAGNANINVELYYNGSLVSEEIMVYLYKDNGTESGLGPLESSITSGGKAVFEKQPDTYFVKTSGQGIFSAARSSSFTVAEGDIKEVRIELEASVAGTIKVRIVENGSPVDGARVLLRLNEQDIDSKVTRIDDDAVLEFPVPQDSTYTLVADHELYCLRTLHNVIIEDVIREVELTPFTGDCGGNLKVKVLDQDGNPVRNATVGLYNEEGFSTGFSTDVTDLNGSAEFRRAPSGDYQAFAFKGNTSGWSEVQHFVQRAADKTTLTVVLIAGDGTVKVQVNDIDGNPLQFSRVAFIDALTFEAIGGGAMPVQDINGTAQIATRADKSVYIIASKEGYTNFTSIVKPVIANSTQFFEAVLEKEIKQGEIEVEFRGLYKGSKIARDLAPGQVYDAMFNIRVPSNKSYDSIGMHIRTGEHEMMELDKIVLKAINAPGRAEILKATSYSQSNGYAADSEHLSSEEAKWANIKWKIPSTGIIQVSAKVKIKETAKVGEQLNLFYRVFGETNGKYKRDPLDNDLGEVESIAGKEGLYSNTKQEIFQVGTESICDESFCFSASILDLEEDLVYRSTDGFSGSIFRQYKLSFEIVNNSEYETNSYFDAEIRLSNPDSGLLLQNYTVFGAQNQEIQGLTSGESTEWISIGNFLPDNRAHGEIRFTPEKSGFSTLLLEVRSGQRVRFSNAIPLMVSSDKKMEVSIEPSILPSGVENSITVTVKDRATGAEIENAIAKVKDRFETVIAEKLTSRKGKATLGLPGLQPGEKLRLVIGKPDYETFEEVLEVDERVLAANPGTIGVSLNAKTAFNAQDAFSLENVTSFNLSIKGIELTGKMHDLIDLEKINNWLYSYIGESIAPGDIMELQLMTFLTGKGKDIQSIQQLGLSLDITTEALGSEWVTSIPVKATIGLGGEVDQPTCFNITRKQWEAGTEGMPIEIQFEAQNNCSISGAPVALRNISAKAGWKTNELGTFSVRTENNAIDLRSGYLKKFEGLLGPEEAISVILTFTPNAGMNGRAEAEIVFSAENPTEGGTQLLENAIEADIAVVNLVDCIGVSTEILVIRQGETGKLGIETIGCGGSNEIRVETDLTITPERFNLGDNGRQEVEIFAEKNIPGQYLVNIYAKGSDETQEKLVKSIRARIQAEGCIELSKYEFDVFDNPNDPYDGYDVIEIINHCYDQQFTVRIKIDEHDWGEALQQGMVYGLLAGAAGGFTKKADQEKTNTAISKKTGIEPEKTEYGTGTWETIQGMLPVQNKPATPPASATTPTPTPKTVSQPITPPDSDIREDTQAIYTMPEPALPTPTGLASAGGGGLLGNLGQSFIGGTGKSLMGEPSAGGWGLQGILIGTVIAYMGQEDYEKSITTIQNDLVYKSTALMMPGASLEDALIVETPSEGIELVDLKETSTEPRPEAPGLNMETRKLAFVNTGGIVQKDPATPIYRILRVEGERIEWEKSYEVKGDESPEPKEKQRTVHNERFRLQFNAFDPLQVTPVSKPIPNCMLGTISGVTGKDAVPRISFDWSWDKIQEDSCDEGNDDYIYCDATQFSIEILKKMQKLKEFIEANKPFSCPSTGRSVAIKDQELSESGYDVGITKIQASRVGENDVNVIVTVESDNGKHMETELRIDLKNEAGTLLDSCTKTVEFISKKIASCTFTGLQQGAFTIKAGIDPILCDGCDNTSQANDSIEAWLLLEGTGIAECSPYSTKRLVQFLEAGSHSQQEIEEVEDLISFNAYLIEDAFTPDFRNDFDQFCKTKSFFDCPTYYSEENGLHRFFGNQDLFSFDYVGGPYAPVDAGKYDVTLNIKFGNENWDFFENGQPSATVSIELTELSAPTPTSPFYYLPFDGQIGIDTENGRQGYGVNFRQTTEDPIKINNALEQTLLTTPIAGSTPVFNGWIESGLNKEFAVLNQASRGILLNVQTGNEETKITLSPSYATPIIMQVDFEKGRDAFGFYSLEIDNSPETTLLKMFPWSGIGVGCKDFSDSSVTEAWQDTWDIHGGISGNLDCAIGTDISDYGVEWCNPLRTGTVSLQTVAFTPQGKTGIMKRTSYGDEMTLYTTSESGSQISLNGVPGMQYNSPGTSGIDSIEDVFELVKDSKVCLIGQGNRISSRFFWNPKTVLEELSGRRSQAEEKCITAG